MCQEFPDAIYNLIQAKDCAIDSAKGPVSHALKTHACNLEVICPQNNNRLNKEVTLKSHSLSDLHLERGSGRTGKDGSQTDLASNTTQNRALERGHLFCGSKESSPPHSSSPFLIPDSSPLVKSPSTFCKESEGWQPRLPQLVQTPDDSLPYSNLRNNGVENPGTGPYCREGNCSILACGRENILRCMTEGRLNHLLDVLRSQQLLSRTDYEMITSFPTLTGRARALLDTCLGLGEKAAQTVVAVLSASKCTPFPRSTQANTVN